MHSYKSSKIDTKNILKRLYEKNLEIYKDKKRLHQILTQVAEVIYAVDPQGRITLFNRAAEDLFGFARGSAMGITADKLIQLLDPFDDSLIVTKAFIFAPLGKDYFSIRQPGTMTPRVKVLTGREKEEKFYKISFSNISYDRHAAGECVIMLSDITAEVELDKKKDEFISIVSHELKTPISIVKTNLWMIQHVGVDNLNDQQVKLLSEMKSGLDRLGRMVNNILDVSRIEQGRIIIDIQKHDLQPIVETLLEEFLETINRSKLKLLIGKNFTKAYVDKEKFMEVLANLVSNSIKYTKKGGIKISCRGVGKFLKISVTDTGDGISKKDQENLFKKFSRAKAGLKQDSPGASTGLGLFIVKKMVEEMGGNCGVKSTYGRGSTFWFTVPTFKIVKKETTPIQSRLKKWQDQTRL